MTSKVTFSLALFTKRREQIEGMISNPTLAFWRSMGTGLATAFLVLKIRENYPSSLAGRTVSIV